MEFESRELTDADLEAVTAGKAAAEVLRIRVRLWLWERTRMPVK